MVRFAYFAGHEQWHPEELVKHAQLAETAGFDMIVASEHFHPWVDDVSASGFAFSTLGAMAAATDNVALATGVTTPLFRFHPGVVAQAAATIDRLCGGRFYLGVGTGENINEGPLGYHFPAYAERNARMTEALEIMRSLLDGEKLNYSGDFYSTLAGAKADGVVTSVKDPEETLRNVLTPARDVAAAAGKPAPFVLATRWCIVAGSDDEAWDILQPWRGLRAPGRLAAVDPAVLRERADELPRDDVVGRYSIAANAEDLIAVYQPLVSGLSADVVCFQVAGSDQEDLIRTLGSEVIPELRRGLSI